MFIDVTVSSIHIYHIPCHYTLYRHCKAQIIGNDKLFVRGVRRHFSQLNTQLINSEICKRAVWDFRNDFKFCCT